jgi:2-desacetyl-2-hydroxyethyl bacteriochlorophyllide A dehydrogenase
MSLSPDPHPRRLVFTGKQEVSLETFECPEPRAGQVLVRTALSLMSTGTENIVFNRLFDPGTHWDSWVKYPFFPGYTSVGTVVAVGPGTTDLALGTRVAVRSAHASQSVVAVEKCAPIPDALPFEEAVWFALAKIAFHGARAAAVELGDTVLVIGAGPIGQMATRWAVAAGAQSVTVVDSVPQRLKMATAGGATAVIQRGIAEAEAEIKAANGGKLPRVVIDSTGNARVFEAALGLAADFGTVVILGDTGTPTQQHLTGDVIRRGLRIVGAHDAHVTAQWDGLTIAQLFFRLAVTNRFSLKGLNTHFFNPDNCADAYYTANTDRANTMGILFDWR